LIEIGFRWSREAEEGFAVQQTFGSAGAGKRKRASRSYKHSAPLEPGREEGFAILQAFGSAGAGKIWGGAFQNIWFRGSRLGHPY